jgi:hypothetical protein
MSGVGYTAAIPSASGAPLENRMAYSTCGGDMRVAPDIGHARGIQFGGRRRKGRKGSRKQRGGAATSPAQRGGACGCNGAMPPAMLQRGGIATSPAQRGGGGGTGGYSTVLSNELGKVHAGFDVRPCPSAPAPTQVGGERSPLDLVSYPTGYGYSPSSVVSTSSAHYLDQQGYNKTCSGGYRKSRKGSRKSRKGSRKSHRKGSRSAHRKH